MENIPLVSFTDEINSQKNNYLKVFEEQLEKGEFIGGDPLKIFENNFFVFSSENIFFFVKYFEQI